jgi:hypothetical protein
MGIGLACLRVVPSIALREGMEMKLKLERDQPTCCDMIHIYLLHRYSMYVKMGKEEWHGKNWMGSINEKRGNNEIDIVCTVQCIREGEEINRNLSIDWAFLSPT